jgi:hypothetical protein
MKIAIKLPAGYRVIAEIDERNMTALLTVQSEEGSGALFVPTSKEAFRFGDGIIEVLHS